MADDCSVRPGESFTARTLRLSVRVSTVEPPPRPAPAAIVDTAEAEAEAEDEDAQPQTAGRLLLRLEAECVLPAIDAHGDPRFMLESMAAMRFGIAGRVDATADGARGFDVGDAVFGVTSTRPSCGADRLVVVEAARTARMPPRLSFVDAASFALAGASAWQMLFKIGRIDAGETVLILGADTPIGACAVQLAAIHGVRTVALATSPASERELLRRGAHDVIDADAGRLEAHCRSAGLVVDTIGGELNRRAAAAIQSGCTLVSCAQRPDAFTAARRRIRSLFCVPDPTAHCLARIAALVESAFLTTRPISREDGDE